MACYAQTNGGFMTKEEIIYSLWEDSNHGTKKEDMERAWNAAIEQAVKIVKENFDECEPWITPEEIETLYTQREMTTSTDMEAEPKPPQSCDSEGQSHPLGDSGSVSGASPCSPIDHLVMLHRVPYNTVTAREAHDYLNRFRREDADFADMGRPLKTQYQGND